MKDRETLLEFPCTYPLKVMGRNTEEIEAMARSIIEKQIPQAREVCYSSRVSSGDKYLSITITLVAHSHDQLKAIYSELSSSNLVLVTL